MDSHVRVLGILHIVLGGIGIAVGLGFLLFFGGLAGALGIATGADAPPEGLVAIPILGLLGAAICVLLLLLSLPGIIVGIGLLKFQPWARFLGILLSIIELLNVPIGTALGIYGLWTLNSAESEPLFQGQGNSRRGRY